MTHRKLCLPIPSCNQRLSKDSSVSKSTLPRISGSCMTPIKPLYSSISLPKTRISLTSVKKTDEDQKSFFTVRSAPVETKKPVKEDTHDTLTLQSISSFSKYDFIEENMLIKQKVLALREELMQTENHPGCLINLNDKVSRRQEVSEVNMRIIAISEKIFNLYGIQIGLMEVSKCDSLMEIREISLDRSPVAYCLKTLALLISGFSFSFIKRVGISSFKFCQDIYLLKPLQDSMVTARIYNGIFPLNKLETDEQITNHFFCVLAYHLQRLIPNFDRRWTELRKISPNKQRRLNFVQSEQTKTKVARTQFQLDSQGQILKAFFPRGNRDHQFESLRR